MAPGMSPFVKRSCSAPDAPTPRNAHATTPRAAASPHDTTNAAAESSPEPFLQLADIPAIGEPNKTTPAHRRGAGPPSMRGDREDPAAGGVVTAPPVRAVGTSSPIVPGDDGGGAFVVNYSPGVVPPPAGAGQPFPRPVLVPDIGPHEILAPNEKTLFSFNDPAHAWMNERPYNVLGFLGQGGFGTVHKVELLTPVGFTVKCEDMIPDWDGKSGMTLERRTDYPFSAGRAQDPSGVGQKLNRSGFCFALKKMTPGSQNCDWEDCLREVKLMRALKKVFIFFEDNIVLLLVSWLWLCIIMVRMTIPYCLCMTNRECFGFTINIATLDF